MAKVIKLRKGLDINLKGKPARDVLRLKAPKTIGVTPESFVGVTPRVVVSEGDKVLAGTPLFENKHYPQVKFASPVSGKVTSVVRGERRKVLAIVIEPDEQQESLDFGKKDVDTMSGEQVVSALLEAGLFGYINQLPYAISTNPDVKPRDIYISAFRDKPLSSDFEFELERNEVAFQKGLSALSKIAPTHLGVGVKQTSPALKDAKDVEVNIFGGPCPAGNVGVQINNLSPVNKGEVVWTVDPTVVIYFGRLFDTGKVDLQHKVAVVGPMIKNPSYVEVIPGTPIGDILIDNLKDGSVRLINGNVLTGKVCTPNDYLGAYTSEVSVIEEGGEANELIGWIMPRLNQFSVNRSYCSWLQGKKREYSLDARTKGGRRNMIMSGEYDKVLPMDIYSEYLIKAILAEDIDKMEQLGIYEVSPEDFALAEFVDSSKLPLQQIVRNGLNMLRKENA